MRLLKIKIEKIFVTNLFTILIWELAFTTCTIAIDVISKTMVWLINKNEHFFLKINARSTKLFSEIPVVL